MAELGADPAQLRALAGELSAQARIIESSGVVITSRLVGSSWRGPDRVRFQGEWRRAGGALHQAATGLRSISTLLRAQATEQEQASSDGGAAKLTAGSVGGLTRELQGDWELPASAHPGLLIRDLAGQGGSTIRVLKTVGANGLPAYIVVIPGVERLDRLDAADEGASDLIDAAQERFGSGGPYSAGIELAMREAGIGPTDSVTLVGHSNGGITAMNIAADGRFNVTGVIAAGSAVPDKLLRMPTGTTVLQLENRLDVVDMGIHRLSAPYVPLEVAGEARAWVSPDLALHRFVPPGVVEREPGQLSLREASGHDQVAYANEIDRIFLHPTGDLRPVTDRLKLAFEAPVVEERRFRILDP